jgi:hypothetical protein
MIEFDRTWSIELQNQAFGRAYNALLNHLHLSPIIGGTYTGGNATALTRPARIWLPRRIITFQNAYTSHGVGFAAPHGHGALGI